ncbi:MAG: hypothetical protein HC880_14850 [Bacteroidia bacterium]|nr:hypothetical protein [Bacteroidia bacterium]
MLVELQNDSAIDYFHHMLYGVSKLVTESKNAILEGATNEFIAKITGLTVEQIEHLRNPKD